MSSLKEKRMKIDRKQVLNQMVKLDWLEIMVKTDTEGVFDQINIAIRSIVAVNKFANQLIIVGGGKEYIIDYSSREKREKDLKRDYEYIRKEMYEFDTNSYRNFGCNLTDADKSSFVCCG